MKKYYKKTLKNKQIFYSISKNITFRIMLHLITMRLVLRYLKKVSKLIQTTHFQKDEEIK